MADLFQKAIAFTEQGDLNKAISICESILLDHPDHLDALQMKAIHLSRIGKHDESINTLQPVVDRHPEHFSLLLNFAEILRLASNFKESELIFQRAQKLNPGSALLFYNWGKLKNDQQMYDEAIVALNKSRALNPNFEKLYLLLSQSFLHVNQTKAAFDTLNDARQRFANSSVILKKFAELLSDLGKSKDAFEAYQRAINIAPTDPELLNNFGGLLIENRQYKDAIPFLEKCVQIDPNASSAFINLALAFQKTGDEEQSKNCYEQVKKLIPENELIRLHFETLCPAIAQSKEDIKEYRKKVEKTIRWFDENYPLQPDIRLFETAYAMPSFLMTYHGRNDKNIKSQWAAFYNKRIKPVDLGNKNQKPKIGFLVTQSHEGVFLKDVGGILKNLSSKLFDMVVLANGMDQLQVIQLHVGRDDIAYHLFSRNLQKAVSDIAAHNLDFLYYWEVGSDILNYLLPFFQLARIQILSWGSAFTSGHTRIQYYWSSHWLEIEDYQTHYSERVVLFENLPTYYYATNHLTTSKTKIDIGLPEDNTIYLCAQNLIKCHPDFDPLIKGILQNDENGIVALITSNQQKVKNQLIQRQAISLGGYASRVIYLNRVPHTDYLQLLSLADVCIDPPHYSGANTTYESLQAGTPVVSIPGKLQRGKYTEAIYQILGLEKFIPSSNQEYIDLAIKLANDQQLQKEVLTAHENGRNQLYSNHGIIDEIESFLLEKHKAL